MSASGASSTPESLEDKMALVLRALRAGAVLDNEPKVACAEPQRGEDDESASAAVVSDPVVASTDTELEGLVAQFLTASNALVASGRELPPAPAKQHVAATSDSEEAALAARPPPKSKEEYEKMSLAELLAELDAVTV
jgi:hypothetical protein